MNPVRNKKSGIFADTPEAGRISHGMKILIGTPIHEIKDYCMERWLKNVSKLKYPADFLMVDNSPGLGYVKKVKGYCAKYGINPVKNLVPVRNKVSNGTISNGVKNYKIKHIEVHQANGADERIGRSREVIRQYILSHDYDAWFSWESDQIIPPDTLNILARIMKAGNYMMIHPSSWTREVPAEPDTSFGVCLIKREVLKKYGFLLEYSNMPNTWHGGDVWFKKQVLKGGGNCIEIYGLIKPIYHLDK